MLTRNFKNRPILHWWAVLANKNPGHKQVFKSVWGWNEHRWRQPLRKIWPFFGIFFSKNMAVLFKKNSSRGSNTPPPTQQVSVLPLEWAAYQTSLWGAHMHQHTKYRALYGFPLRTQTPWYFVMIGARLRTKDTIRRTTVICDGSRSWRVRTQLNAPAVRRTKTPGKALWKNMEIQKSLWLRQLIEIR